MRRSPPNAARAMIAYRPLGWLCALLFAVSVLSNSAVADPESAEYELDIARLPLSAAMDAFAHQTGVQYAIFDMEIARLLVGPVQGRFTPRAAIERLLRATGVSFEWVNERTVRIGAVEHDSSPPALAQQCADEIDRSTADGAWIERVLVCEPRIVDSDPLLAQLPPPQFLVELVDETVMAPITDLLGDLVQQPYVHSDGRSNGGQHADLRGMGPDATATLINGRRTAPSALSIARSAFDVRAIPLPAVERVEVTADLAPLRYGADTSGGVVNVILKRDIQEPELELRYGSSNGGGAQREISLGAGWSNERSRAAIVLDYLDLDTLLGSERDRWRNQDYRRFGSVDLRSTATHPGNITSIDGRNLPGLPAPFAAIPAGTSGDELTPHDYLPGAGRRNLDSQRKYWSILPSLRQAAGVATAEVQLGAGLSAFAELLHSQRNTVSSFGPPWVAGLTVPGDNPFNPFNAPVRIDYLFEELGAREQRIDTDLARGVVGLKGQRAAWEWELSLLHSREASHARLDNEIDLHRVIAALAEPDPARSLNVFHDAPAAEPDVLAALLAPPIVADYDSNLSQLAGRLSGSIAQTRAGPIAAAFGFQANREGIAIGADGSDVSTLLADSRLAFGAFNEWQIPLLAQSSQIGSLSLAAAVRVDRYDGFSLERNEQFGLAWQPSATVTIDTAYGTTFRPPSLIELRGPQAQTVVSVSDPRRGGEVVPVTLHSGGNPNLQPSPARSLTATVTFTPAAAPGLRMSARYWETSVRSRIAHTPWYVLLEHEDQFANNLVRSAPTADDLASGVPGRLLALDVTPDNSGSLLMRGVDVQAAHQFSTSIGEFLPSVTATYVQNYLAVDIPNQQPAERVGVAHAQGTVPQLRALASLLWRRGALGFDTAARYNSGYEDVRNSAPTGRHVSSQVLVDMQVVLDLDAMAPKSMVLQGLTLTAGAKNIFDREPPFSDVTVADGYDSSQGNLLQRFWYVHISKRL